MWLQANDFVSLFFSSSSSRKLITSFNAFVLLEQLTSLCFDEWSMLKNYHVFSRTSSRTHFEVLGLGFEALRPRKLPCLRLEDSTIFKWLKFCITAKNFFLDRFSWRSEKKFWRPFFFEEHFHLCAWSLALASSIPALASRESFLERLSLASDFLYFWPLPRALCPRLHLLLLLRLAISFKFSGLSTKIAVNCFGIMVKRKKVCK